MGALGCRQYINYFLVAPLIYQPKLIDSKVVISKFVAQVPPNKSLAGTNVYLQSAESELSLDRKTWTNAAGLTTSSGLRIQLASKAPSLGLSIVRSSAVSPGKTLPDFGRVDVERAPVMRVMYRDK
jgi:hypothetical protein